MNWIEDRVEGKWRFCLQLLQYCYMTLLWIYGLTAVLSVQGRGEMAVLSTVTRVLLHHITMDIWTEGNVVSTG